MLCLTLSLSLKSDSQKCCAAQGSLQGQQLAELLAELQRIEGQQIVLHNAVDQNKAIVVYPRAEVRQPYAFVLHRAILSINTLHVDAHLPKHDVQDHAAADVDDSHYICVGSGA